MPPHTPTEPHPHSTQARRDPEGPGGPFVVGGVDGTYRVSEAVVWGGAERKDTVNI